MNGWFWDICTAIGFILILFTFGTCALLVVGMCVEGWRDRRRTYVPRQWLDEQLGRDCRRHPSRREDR